MPKHPIIAGHPLRRQNPCDAHVRGRLPAVQPHGPTVGSARLVEREDHVEAIVGHGGVLVEGGVLVHFLGAPGCRKTLKTLLKESFQIFVNHFGMSSTVQLPRDVLSETISKRQALELDERIGDINSLELLWSHNLGRKTYEDILDV